MQGFAKLGGRNEVHMAPFPPWSKQLRAGMHFAAETHVWIDLDVFLKILKGDIPVPGPGSGGLPSESDTLRVGVVGDPFADHHLPRVVRSCDNLRTRCVQGRLAQTLPRLETVRVPGGLTVFSGRS